LTADLLVRGTAVGDEASIVAFALIGIAALSADFAFVVSFTLIFLVDPAVIEK
jgi:hypothetical protein